MNLFKGMAFSLGRETPKYSLELVIRSAGGRILEEISDEVTHHVIDRPLVNPRGDREYIQPQWIYDCLNFKTLLPIGPYRPGCELPAHLSPFVDYRAEGYVPERLQEIYQLKGEDIQVEKEVEAEKKDLAKAMMNKKLRALYTRMQFVLRKKHGKVERLTSRRAEIDNS